MTHKDRDRHLEYCREYYLANREQRIAQSVELVRLWRANNPDRARESQRLWRERNREYVARHRRRYRESLKDLVPDPRIGAWSEAEDVIALRSDLTLKEKAVMLQRGCNSVEMRIKHVSAGVGHAIRLKPVSCARCASVFKPREGNQKFCSTSCASPVTHPPKPCPVCGDEFKPTRGSRKKDGSRWSDHCSRQCAGASRRKVSA